MDAIDMSWIVVFAAITLVSLLVTMVIFYRALHFAEKALRQN